jgi:hypothetical protein
MDLHRSGEKALTDERILGSNDIVERALGEAHHRSRHLFFFLLTGKRVQQVIARNCEKRGFQ